MARLGSWVESHADGIYVRPADAWIDPSQAKARAIVTHGHSDHARGGHGAVLATPETLAILPAGMGQGVVARSPGPVYRTPYRVEFTVPPAELVGDLEGTERGDRRLEAEIPFHQWYAPRTLERWHAWGPIARDYPAPVGLERWTAGRRDAAHEAPLAAAPAGQASCPGHPSLVEFRVPRVVLDPCPVAEAAAARVEDDPWHPPRRVERGEERRNPPADLDRSSRERALRSGLRGEAEGARTPR